MEIYFIAALAFFAVAALVMAIFMFSTKEPNKVLESRLDVLAGKVTREESRQTDLLRKNYTETDRNSLIQACLLYTSPSPRDRQKSRMPSSA